jgi:hypothetical protein
MLENVNLTENQKEWFVAELAELIEEHEGAASNESLWAKGADTQEQSQMHVENAAEHEEFVAFLKSLQTAVQNN